MSLLCNFLVLLFELDHIILQFQDFFLLGVTNALHLNDAIFENLI